VHEEAKSFFCIHQSLFFNLVSALVHAEDTDCYACSDSKSGG